jgi:hypothetical protein
MPRATTWTGIGSWSLAGALQVSGYQNIYVAAFLGLVGVACFIHAIKSVILKTKLEAPSMMPLSRVRMETILLRGTDLLRFAEESKKHFGDTLMPEFSKKEKAWLGEIAQWLNTKPYLKSEVLASVFVPWGASSYDAFTTRITTRISRITLIPNDEIGP